MKKIIFLLTLALLVLGGCSTQKEVEVKEPTDREILKSILDKVSSDTSLYTDIFNDNRLADLVKGATPPVREFYLDVLDHVSFKDYSDGTMTLLFPDEAKLIEKACNDTNGFVQDYNNFISIGIADSELEEYVYDYFCKLLQDKNLETIEVSFKISDSFKIGKKLDTSSYYSETLESMYQTISTTLASAVTDAIKSEESTGSITSLKIGHSYVLTNYNEILDKDNNVTVDEQKYLLNIKEVIGREEALEEIYTLSESNRALCISKDAKVFLLRYDVTNVSNDKLILENEFYLASEDNRLYKTEGFRISGLMSEAALAVGETKTLTVLLVGDSERIVHYNPTSKIMYNIDLTNDTQGIFS